MSVNAYELFPPLKNVKLFDDPVTKITSFDISGVDLFVGTNKGTIIRYKYEQLEDDEETAYFYDKVGSRVVNEKHPILCVKTAGFMNVLVVLCDGVISFYSVTTLEPTLLGSKLKGVTSFLVQEGRTREGTCVTQMCVGLKQKMVQMFVMEPEKLVNLREVPTKEIPQSLSFHAGLVCVALSQSYALLNLQTGAVTELFEFDHEYVKPLITHVGKDEFLLNGPSSLGIFANVVGASQRPPIQWSNNLIDVTFQHPYILALNDEFVTVHSISDQQQKQSIPLSDGTCLCRGNKIVMVGRAQDVYVLARQPWDRQACELLSAGHVDEALKLAEYERKSAPNKDTYMKKLRRVLVRVGFVRFEEGNFKEAQTYFEDGYLDIRELICLYPDLLPRGYKFTPTVVHRVSGGVQALCSGDLVKATEYHLFLMRFLEEHRDSKLGMPYKQVAETALVKLYAELKPHDLQLLITTMGAVDLEDVIAFLESRERHHACATLHNWNGSHAKALQLWKRLAEEELQDPMFPGIDFLVEILCNLEHHDLVFQYADWLLSRDQDLGVRLFIDRPVGEPGSDRMRPEHLVDYLQRYPRAAITYMEHLIFECKNTDVKYHTYLAKLYLDTVQSLQAQESSHGNATDKLQDMRHRFQRFLETSDYYRVQQILSQVKQADGMLMETAVLYGKLGNHADALAILVHELSDFPAAERYCTRVGRGMSTEPRRRLFESLLRVYLDPGHKKYEIYSTAAIELLNNEEADFDHARVLSFLPDSWALSILAPFLCRGLRNAVHNTRMSSVAVGLSRAVHMRSAADRAQLAGATRTVLEEEAVCGVCYEPLGQSAFARLPSGVLLHPSCAPVDSS